MVCCQMQHNERSRTWMPLLSGMGDSCAEMPHMPNLVWYEG